MNNERTLLLPGEKFMVRAVTLLPDEALDVQIERAVESFSPFPLRQLFYGSITTAERNVALIYFGFRKHFLEHETPLWKEADAIYPSFLAWCAAVPATPSILIHSSAVQSTAIAWNGISPMPVAILARRTHDSGVEELLAEIRLRTGLTETAFRSEEGEISARNGIRKRTVAWSIMRSGQDVSEAIGETPVEALIGADVRDREEMAVWLGNQKRNRWLWRTMAAAVGLVLLAAAVDVSNFARSRWLHWRERQLTLGAALVERIQSEQAMEERLEALTNHRLKLLEILTLLNVHRPDGVEFSRLMTSGPYSVEINAQTKSPDEVRQYETQLRAMSAFSSLHVDGLQTRDGHTTFMVQAVFNPSALSSPTIR